MAVVSVGEIWQRRRSQYRDSKLTHDLMYQVICDNGHDGTATAIGAAGIPAPGDAFVDVYGNVGYLNSINCDPKAGAHVVFEVQCEFVTLDPSQPDDNPLNAPPTFAFTYSEQTSSYFVDNSPNTVTNAAGQTGPFNVTNSAGDPFETFMQRESGELQIVMTRNESTNDVVTQDNYKHTTNAGIVTLDGNSFAVGTLKLSPITATKNRKTLKSGSAIVYYTKTYTLKASHSGWTQQPLDVGFRELVGDKTQNTQNLRPIVDTTNSPVTKPWPLDGTGKKKPNTTDSPAILTFMPYLPMDWTIFNFA